MVEFLKVDHYELDNKVGLKEFGKKLTLELENLQKQHGFFSKTKWENCLFKTTSTKENIDLDKFKGAHLSDLKHPDMADEKQFVFKYEKEMNGLLKTLPAFKT